MSEALDVRQILSHGMDCEKDYDWLGATEFYRKALESVSATDHLNLGQVQERIGYALYRAAMQAESQEECREGMRQAVSSYEKAKAFYGRWSELGKTPRMLRCDAMIAYLGHWLALETPEKKRLLVECWKLAKESLGAFEEAGEAGEYGKTYNQLSSSTVFEFTRESDFQAREKTMREAVEHGEKAIRFLCTFEDPYELARAYAKTVVCLGVFAYYFLDLDERESYYQKGLGYWQKANELSEETATAEMVYPVYGVQILLGLEGTDEALTNFRKALEYGRKTKDKFTIGCALDWLAYHNVWKISAVEDPDEGKKLLKRALEYAEDAKHKFSQISFASPRGDCFWVEDPYPEYYWRLASFETDLRKRHDLLEKALGAHPDILKRAEDSGYPEVMMYVYGGRSVILFSLAKIEVNSEKKKRLLEEALEHFSEATKITEQLEPFLYWNRGAIQSWRSNVESELSDLAKDAETRKELLQEAILHKESALKLYVKELALFESKGRVPVLFASLGGSQRVYGDFLNRLYGLTGDRDNSRKAVEAFNEAAKSYQKLNLTSRLAECHWKAARTYDALGEHLKAAESFEYASDNYRTSAEKICQLKEFYQDHALYMQAWTEIEKARHHHARQEHNLAEGHFEKASNMHKSLKHWSYLTPNYSAWTQLEHAEDLSRRDQCEEAIPAFRQAATLFKETKEALHINLGKIEDQDEKQMAIKMLEATDLRHEYCIGRITLEEARILDKRGDHFSSSEKFSSAARIFEKIAQAMKSEQDKKEFKLIATLSQAWQRMTRAEAEESPYLYLEASQLFEEAKELSSNEKNRTLMSGHSRFCKALEVGTRFADSRDPNLHTAAIQHLESAATNYVKAGFQSASEFAKATELLFDAYVQVDNAKKESEPEKKAKHYAMAEKILQSSAGSFMKAEHPEKREQVLRLLEKVREERELAKSLCEVIHSPPIVSTTTAFAIPGPTHENAVGLERFEHADIQANLIIRHKELKIGDDLNLEIELVNAGKGPALLIKLAEVIPKGFDVAQKPETYRVEDSYLNMKGKRLDPLKTEEVKLVLKPKVQGTFPLKPRIHYLDENGKYKSYEVEPITVTVKELGIKGWIMGEKRQ